MFGHNINKDLELILLQEHHATALFERVDRNRDHLRQWLCWVDQTQSADDTLRFIKKAQRRYAQNNGFACGIFFKGDIVGVIVVNEIDTAHNRTSIAYWLDADYAGRGIMTHAIGAVLDYLFDTLGLNYVSLRAKTRNVRSRSIAERMGFKHEGTLRDYTVLRGQFYDLEHYGMRAAERRKD
ncbi:MAG: GNAT family N-acetyltransferase [Pseudomonadota bacterium]